MQDARAMSMSYEEYLDILSRRDILPRQRKYAFRYRQRPLTRQQYDSLQGDWRFARSPLRKYDFDPGSAVMYGKRGLAHLRATLQHLNPQEQRYLAERVKWSRCPCISPCDNQMEKSWCYIGGKCRAAPRHLGFSYRLCNPSTDSPQSAAPAPRRKTAGLALVKAINDRFVAFGPSVPNED